MSRGSPTLTESNRAIEMPPEHSYYPSGPHTRHPAIYGLEERGIIHRHQAANVKVRVYGNIFTRQREDVGRHQSELLWQSSSEYMSWLGTDSERTLCATLRSSRI